MDTFPTTPIPVYPCVVSPVFNTLIQDYENGGEQRRSKWMFPKFDVKLNYYALTETNAKILWEFYMDQIGAYKAFYFFDFYVFDHNSLYIGTGDGGTVIFDIPGKSTSALTYYNNGVEIASGVTFLSTGGGGGSDRLEFATAPAVGDIITGDFTGYLRIKCRFKNDKLDRENFTLALFRYGLELKGLK